MRGYKRSTISAWVSVVLGGLALATGMMACNGGTPTPTPATPTPATPTATSTQPAGKLPPVLIMHGFRGGPSLRSLQCPRDKEEAKDWGERWIGENPIAPGSYGGLKEDIEALGFPVTYSHYLSSPCYTATYTDSVPYLAKDIEVAKNGNPDTKVIIIAHSTGGLVARAYMEEGKHNDVSDLFTLGTPFNGVNVSNFWLGMLSVQNSLPINSYIQNHHIWENFSYQHEKPYRSESNRNPNVRYHLIGGNFPTLGRTAQGIFLDIFGGNRGQDDGLIPLSSALYPKGATLYLEYKETHDDTYGSPDYFKKGITTSEHARNYIMLTLQNRLNELRASPTVLVAAPTLEVPPTQDLSNPKPLCDENVALQALADINPEDHVGDALKQYAAECGKSVEGLVAVAESKRMNVQIAVFNQSEADAVLAGGSDVAGIPSEQAPVSEELPGSGVIVRGDQVLVLGPVHARPLIQLNKDQATIQMFNTELDQGRIGRVFVLERSDGDFFEPDPLDPTVFKPSKLQEPGFSVLEDPFALPLGSVPSSDVVRPTDRWELPTP